MDLFQLRLESLLDARLCVRASNDVGDADSEAVHDEPIVDDALSLREEVVARRSTILFPDDVHEASARVTYLRLG